MAKVTLKQRFGGAWNLLGLVLVLVVLFVAFSLKVPDSFPTSRNVETLLRQNAITTLVAVGMTYVIMAGGIDLSVGSVAAFAGVVIAWFLRKGFDPLTSAALGIASGALLGLANGVLVTRLKVGPFIVTLGTLLVVRGAAKGLANEQKIDAPRTWLDELLAVLQTKDRWMLLPPGVWLTLILSVLLAWTLRSTRFGRHVVAVGSNESAARLCGVPTDRVKVGVYTLSGLFAGLAGLMFFSRLTVGDPTIASGLELEAIAAAVIGGASLAGGEGSIWGTLLGAMIMTTLRSGASQMELPNWIQEIVTGAIIVLAVALDQYRKRRSASAGG